MSAQIKLVPGNLYKVIDSLAFASFLDPFIHFLVWQKTKYVFLKNKTPIIMFLRRTEHKGFRNIAQYHFLVNNNTLCFIDATENYEIYDNNNINGIKFLNYLEILK